VLDNVAIVKVPNSELLNKILRKAAALMTENRFALLVVDSVIGLFRHDFKGRGELAMRQ